MELFLNLSIFFDKFKKAGMEARPRNCGPARQVIDWDTPKLKLIKHA